MYFRRIALWMGGAFALSVALAGASGPSVNLPSPAEAAMLLRMGNGRFVLNKAKRPNAGSERRYEVTEGGQHPFATVITCSDSRVPVEIVFDQGIGDVFVIRVAGNVCDTDEIGSIEYGVDHLGTPVLVVLGHTHCGAVTAVATGAEVHGSIPELVDNIAPAVARVRERHPGADAKDMVPEAIRENVWRSIEDLLGRSEATRKRVESGKLQILGAVYDIQSGEVNWMGEHPKQGDLLGGAGSVSHGDAPAHAAESPAPVHAPAGGGHH